MALEKDGSKSDRAMLLALEPPKHSIADLGEYTDDEGEAEHGTEVLH